MIPIAKTEAEIRLAYAKDYHAKSKERVRRLRRAVEIAKSERRGDKRAVKEFKRMARKA